MQYCKYFIACQVLLHKIYVSIIRWIDAVVEIQAYGDQDFPVAATRKCNYVIAFIACFPELSKSSFQ